jgi:carboxyl-terminal processing protease
MSSPIQPRTSVLVLLLLLAASRLFAQTNAPDAKPSEEVVQYLDRFQLLIKQHALCADSIDWGRLRREVTEQSRGLATVEDCRPVLDHILRTLRNAGDKHSRFLPKESATRWTSSSYSAPPAESRYLENGIGYLKIPAFSSLDTAAGRAFSQGIRRQLEALRTQHDVTGWVVDLRQNTGGNMYPMINGLQALLGTGTYGYFITPHNKKGVRLRSRGGTGPGQRAVIAAKTQQRVAVLIGAQTASSGEMVAIALKGLPHAKLFGQPSAGYTTTNATYKLTDGAYLFLAAGYMADKNRHKYLPNIAPDVMVESSPLDAQDKTMEAARRWLLEAK